MAQNNTSDWPYYYWTDTRPTGEGRWYLRTKLSKEHGEIVLVKGIKDRTGGTLICYFDPDCGWRPCDELPIEYWEWSSKPVPFPMVK